MVLTVLSFSLLQTNVYAEISREQRSLYSAGVNYYDAAVASQPSCAAGSITLSGSNNRAKVFNYLVAKGLEKHQAAGIFGNLAVESSPAISPFAEEKPGQDEGGKGIAQWTATRRTAFERAAQEAGVITRQAAFKAVPEAEKAATEDKALQFNLDYLWKEATERGDIDKLKQEGTDLSNSVSSWLRWFERAGIPNVDDRLKEGNAALTEFGNGTSSSSNSTSGCGGSASGGPIVEIALSQVDLLETDKNCSKYFNNNGSCVSTPWCAAFVTWVYGQAGFTTTNSNLAKGVGKWFYDNKFFFKWQEPYRVLPGDVFVKGRGSGTGWDGTGHTGIVVEVNGFSIVTVEGNSSDKVKKNTYADYRKIPELIGFGRYVDKGSVQPEPGFDPTTGATGQYNTNKED